MAEGLPDLGKQIGPLPLGAWIAVVAGGLGIAYYTKNSGGGGTTDTTTDGTVVDDTGTPDGTADGTVGGWTATTPDTSTTGDGAITDNDSWGNAAINWLIAQGYDPGWSYSAITKALAGGRGENRLSVREYALWRAALRHLGAPPTPITLPPPTPIPKPHKPTKPTKPTPGTKGIRVITILPGMTLKSLANRFYGSPNKWDVIFEANRVGHKRANNTPGILKDPNGKLPVGKNLVIPAHA
jgi:hypothetical protein